MIVKIMCSNETLEKHECVDFGMNVEVHLDFDFQDLVFKFNISDIILADTVIRRDHIGLNDTSFEQDF